MNQPSAFPWRLASLVLATALAACSKPQPAPEPVRSVKVLTVGTSALASSHEYAGEVRPRVESRLGFRVAGKIVQRHAELGQRVRSGQVLAQLDAQDYRLAADAARAQVAAAATQRDLAAADFKRFAALKDQNFISGAELQRREASLKAAQAQLDQAQAQLAGQANQAGYTRLSADADGVITGIEAEPGQVVNAGSPVVRIARDGPRDVVFSVPEDKVARTRPGSPVAVRLWAGGEVVQGEVREVAASADPVTRTYSVKVSLPAGAQPPLGSTAYVSPQAPGTAGTPVIKLPTSALRQEGQGSAVWVLDRASMTVRSQPVQIATADGNEAVIAGGLQPGMLVVSAGVHVLAPGQKVRIYEERTATAGAARPAPAQPAVAATAAVQPVAAR
ncbi:efflux RND transporter periplasmic adaptor subunit [Ramlibacter tataouinensis]|uniref:efflux RND transporter periplasmic adaptor subunit n=1 Tax=Ramlibacter tataouinensis TaxID=94132 RepID=UPI0022F397EE|nr:efflux RND transporter periplasmic adaptor subunit [Ramlibacter tataouinensis]WBY01619.1 efflux RND transporter periplasmic adaptor subunit [Ramlibacter tataouinensis]